MGPVEIALTSDGFPLGRFPGPRYCGNCPTPRYCGNCPRGKPNEIPYFLPFPPAGNTQNGLPTDFP